MVHVPPWPDRLRFHGRRVLQTQRRRSGRISSCVKVVNDVLVWDSAYMEHVQTILQRCHNHRIAMNHDKLVSGSSSLQFCVYSVFRQDDHRPE